MLLRDDRRHGESGAGLPLTFRAMTHVDDSGRTGDFVTNRAALASAGLWKIHRPHPSTLPGTAKLARNATLDASPVPTDICVVAIGKRHFAAVVDDKTAGLRGPAAGRPGEVNDG